MIEHSNDTFCKSPISALCNAILLRSVPDSVFSLDAAFFQVLLEGVADVLPPFVIAETLNLVISLKFCPSFVRLEAGKGLKLALHEEDGSEARVNVDERDPVLVSLISGLERTVDV